MFVLKYLMWLYSWCDVMYHTLHGNVWPTVRGGIDPGGVCFITRVVQVCKDYCSGLSSLDAVGHGP